MKTLHLVDPAVRDVIASLRTFDPERSGPARAGWAMPGSLRQW